ncbi:MAG TPA: hypothetical protein VIU11_11435 [Nakamurella sp.]
MSSALARTPAAPRVSICIAAPVARASGRQPGPDPRVSSSNADQLAAGTPVAWAAIVERRRQDVLAAPAADAITAFNGGTGHAHPSIASTAARVRIQAGAADRPDPPVSTACESSSRALTVCTSALRTAPIRPRVDADPMHVCAAAASAA